jgi:D-3-phosphoglycerate dehydrogenase
VATKNTRLITSSFAAGWLETALGGAVNLVNAEPRLRERGIAVTEEVSAEPGDFSSAIQVEVETDRKKYIAAGTIFGKEYQRLVRLGAYRLDAHLDGTLLIFSHHDRPGLIGFLGTELGKHGVNIAQMNVGREVPGGEAIGVVNLDSVPDEAAVEAVRKHPDMISVSVIKLPAQGELPSWLA